MSTRGDGDEGLAEDLAKVAEERLRPDADWTELGALLAKLNEKLSKAEREKVIAAARVAAREHPDALALIELKIQATT